MKEKGLFIQKYVRYMDDGRAFLPAIRRGWRWENGDLLYCMRWEQEDKELSLLEVTKRVVGEYMQGVYNFLKFTTETEEDFEDRWLPTLDLSLRVDSGNNINWKYPTEVCHG